MSENNYGGSTSPKFRAIETNYRGFKFRSRLEARWAVFFDHMGTEWLYEPQGFEVDGLDRFRYLPDFFLPKAHVWAEVKGDDNSLRTDSVKISALMESGAPISDTGLILLGEIPQRQWGLTLHPFIKRTGFLPIDHLLCSWVSFLPGNSAFIEIPARRDWLQRIFDIPEATPLTEASNWSARCRQIQTKRGYKDVMDAYDAARGARFEFADKDFDARRDYI